MSEIGLHEELSYEYMELENVIQAINDNRLYFQPTKHGSRDLYEVYSKSKIMYPAAERLEGVVSATVPHLGDLVIEKSVEHFFISFRHHHHTLKF